MCIRDRFGAIQKSATASLDSLASRGFLLDSTIDAMDMRRLNMASDLGGNRVGTLHIVDPNTNTLRVINSNRSSQFLRQSGIDFFNNNSALSNADSFAKIEIHGADVSGEVFKLRELDEVVTPAILDDASPDNVFKISEESKSYLETNGIYVVNKESAKEVRKKLKQKFRKWM